MVKVVSLSNKAYSILKKSKKGGESFSDVVVRLTDRSKKTDLSKLVGVWKNDKEIDSIFNKILKERHEHKPLDL